MTRKRNSADWVAAEIQRLEHDAAAILKANGFTPTKMGDFWSFPPQESERLRKATRRDVILARYALASLHEAKEALPDGRPTWSAVQALCLSVAVNPPNSAESYIKSQRQRKAATSTRVSELEKAIHRALKRDPRGTWKQVLRHLENDDRVLSVTDTTIEWTDRHGIVQETPISGLADRVSRARRRGISR